MLGKTLVSILSFFMVACSVQPTHKSLIDTELPRLLPVRDFVANTSSQGHYRISPDGKKLAWKAVAGIREEIFVRSIGKKDARNLGFSAQGYSFVWAQDSEHLLFIKDAGGNENFHLFRVSINEPDQEPVDITPLKNTRVGIQQIIEDDPEHILIVHNGRDETIFDLYKLNIKTGAMQLLYQNSEDIVWLLTDRKGKLQARVRQDKTNKYLELPNAGKWKELTHWTQDDTVHPLKVTADETAIHMLSNLGRDKIALVKLNIDTARETVVYEHPNVDVTYAQFNQQTLDPALVYTQDGYPQVTALDSSLNMYLDQFRNKGPSGIYVSSIDDSQQRVILDVNDDREVAFYYLDRRSGKTTLLGKRESSEYADALATMKPVSYTARDGLTLHGYLTLPETSRRPLPMVMLVHGGPFARYIWQYNRQAQFLANRGYAVLQVNYRGSSGYGRNFMEAAIGEFAGKMHDDLIDGVNWAVDKGIADKDRVAIMGASFGGYATLVGLTRTPTVFACGIDIVGPADLISLDKNFPAYWKPFMHRWRKYAGNPDNDKDRERMREKSPLYHADKVERPLLIIQGANDVRVKQGQSDKMVEALRAAGKEVEYEVISGEGHRIRHWKNRLSVYRKTEDFLAQCLGGRSSGFDYYQLGSWLF